MTRSKIGITSSGLSCSLYQHHRILENRRPGELMFRDIFTLTYFEKYLKHKKFKIHLPSFGGRVMEMRERKGREGKKRDQLFHSHMNTQREFPLSVYQTIANTGKATAVPCQQLNVLLLIYLFIQIAFNGRGDCI